MPGEMVAYTAACNELEAAQDRLSGMIHALSVYVDALRRDQKSALHVPENLPSPAAIRAAYLETESARGALDRCRAALSPEQRKSLRDVEDVGKPRLSIDDC